MNAFRKAKKEQAIAARKTARETAKVYEMTDSISNAIETYEKNHNIDTTKANVICKISIPNLIKTWFAHGHTIAFIPNKFVKTDGKFRLLSNLEYEIDTACRTIQSAYNRKIVFSWNIKNAGEKIASEDVVKAYFRGENPVLTISFL